MAPLVAFALACGGPSIRVPPLRNATASEHDRIVRALPGGATLLEARALGDAERIIGVYVHDGPATEPPSVEARCGASVTTPLAVSGDCSVISLARWDPAASAIDARWALSEACGSGDRVSALVVEVADLDGDGSAEIAIAFDVRTLAGDVVHVARVIDATTFRVQLAEDVDDILDTSADGHYVHPDPVSIAITSTRTAATFAFERVESGSGSALLITTESPPEVRELGEWYRPPRAQFAIGPQREAYDFTDAHDRVERVPYDAAADCWRVDH